jgi:hypothetical protein
VVGASDALGVGSSAACPPFVDCPNGMGYAPIAARDLTARGYAVAVVNLGIPTGVVGPAFQTLGQQHGRFIAGNFLAQAMPFVRANATLVTVFAGPNEVNTVTAALGAGAGGADPGGFIDAQVRAFGSDFSSLVTGIRGQARSARIVALNVPNLAALPSLAAASLAQRQAAQRASVGMSAAVNRSASQDVIVVDVMCDSRSYAATNYSADGFHPNDAGYAYLAGEIVRAAISGSYPAPLGSCPFMTAVPGM